MSREFQRAVAAEIKAEIARKGLRRTAIGGAVGIDPTTWGNYFVNVSRDVPLRIVTAVCEEIGVPFSEIVARAEAVAQPEEPTEAEERAVARARRRRGIAE